MVERRNLTLVFQGLLGESRHSEQGFRRQLTAQSSHIAFIIRRLQGALRSHSVKEETAGSIPTCIAVQYHWIQERLVYSSFAFMCVLSSRLFRRLYTNCA